MIKNLKNILKFFFLLSILIYSKEVLAQSLSQMLEQLKRGSQPLLEDQENKDLKILRQAKMSFAVTKSFIEKDSNGAFQLRQAIVCERSFILNVIDTSVSQPQFYFASDECKTNLDDKAGLASYEASILLGASLDENTQTKDKTYTPVAIVKIDGKSILMTSILKSKVDDLKQLYFNLPKGDQDFYQDQTLVVGAKLLDK